MRILGTFLVLFVIMGFALLRGGRPERFAIIGLALPLGLDPIYHQLFGYREFVAFDLGHALFDSCVMVGFGWLAIRANRMWTLLIAALQVPTLVAHSIAAFELPGIRGAYWAMTEVPFYVQLFIVSCGLIAHTLRERRIGRYPDWRFPLTE